MVCEADGVEDEDEIGAFFGGVRGAGVNVVSWFC